MTQTQRMQKREYGLDLLRCLSMLFIIVLHVVGHGGLGLAYPAGSAARLLVSLTEIAAYPAVDCFVLLSGYLLCSQPFKPERIVRFWSAAFFWSAAIQSIFFFLKPETLSPGTVLYMFLPVLSGRYWFLNAYIVMVLVSPALNRLLRELPRWQLRGLLLVSMLVFSVSPVLAMGSDVFKTQNGYAFPWFLVLYLWGGYIRLYTPKLNLRQSSYALLGYVVLVLGHLLWIWLTGVMGKYIVLVNQLSGVFLKYTSIPVFGSALCLLLFFRSERFAETKPLSVFFAKLSPLGFGVYLIQDHTLVRGALIQNRFFIVGNWAWYQSLLWIVGAACGIFLVCITLEWFRIKLFRIFRLDQAADKLCKRLTGKVVMLLKR